MDEKTYRKFLMCADNFKALQDQNSSPVSFSQWGQDIILEHILWLCGEHMPNYLDLGCNRPVDSSNTALFYRKGCRGVVIDASPKHECEWNELRPEDIFVNVAVVPDAAVKEVDFFMFDDYSPINSINKEHIEMWRERNKSLPEPTTHVVRAMTVSNIVTAYCGGLYPSLLAIDIEGMDLQILKSLSFAANAPKIIIIEDKSPDARETLSGIGFTPVLLTVGDTIAIRNDLSHLVKP